MARGHPSDQEQVVTVALSPLLAGVGEDVCLGLVEGTALLSGVHRDARLLSVRRSHDHLFPALSVPPT